MVLASIASLKLAPQARNPSPDTFRHTFLLFCTIGGRSGKLCQEFLTEPEKFGVAEKTVRASQPF